MTDVQKIREYHKLFVVEITDPQTNKIWNMEGIKNRFYFDKKDDFCILKV